jgi:hypothetical protein
VNRADQAADVEKWKALYGELAVRLVERAEAAEAERDRYRAVVEAAKLVRQYEQAGGDDWWIAHDKLYRALDALVLGDSC